MSLSKQKLDRYLTVKWDEALTALETGELHAKNLFSPTIRQKKDKLVEMGKHWVKFLHDLGWTGDRIRDYMPIVHDHEYSLAYLLNYGGFQDHLPRSSFQKYFWWYNESPPVPYQQAILDAQDKNIIVCCGRQVGKTDVVAFKGVIELFYNEFPFECMIISKSEGMARNMFSRIVHLIDKNNILRWCMYSLSKTEGTLDTGARIYSKPAGTEGTSARGPRPKLLIVDEAAYVPDAVFRAISPSVMGVNGYKVYLSTPAGRIGTFWEVWNKSEEFTDWHREQLPHWDVPWNTEEACKKQADLEGYTTDEYRQEYGGEFIDFSLNAFPLNLIEACYKRPPAVKYCRAVGEPGKDYFAGLDIGYTVDETVLTITHKELNSAKHPQYSNEPWWVYVDAIYVWSGMTPAQIALECQANVFPYWRIRRLNIDTAGKGEALLYAFIDRDKSLQSIMNPLPIHSSQVKIELYINALTLMSNFQVKFPNPSREPKTRKLRMQLAQLKKETTKAGRVVIGHPGIFSGGVGSGHKYHDDFYDSLSLALYNYMMMIPNRIQLAFASYGRAFGGR